MSDCFGAGGAALVTGGAKRLGWKMAEALAKRGMAVAIHYRHSESAASEAVKALQELGAKSVALRADFMSERETAALVKRANTALGMQLTVLVNSAALFERDHISSANRNDWDRHIETNLRAPFVLTQQFSQQAPPPKTDDNNELLASACIVNLVDHCVVRPTSEFSTYTLAKMGLWGLTQTSATALAPAVRVNAIGPGPVLIAARQSAQHFVNQRQSTPLNRGTSAEEIVKAMEFLLDSPSMTGQLLCLDGGRNLSWQGA